MSKDESMNIPVILTVRELNQIMTSSKLYWKALQREAKKHEEHTKAFQELNERYSLSYSAAKKIRQASLILQEVEKEYR